MNQPVWAQAFPGGVADADLQHALVRSARGPLVALRLADGQVLWRSGQALRPLLLGQGLVFGLALGAPIGTSSASAPAQACVVALVLHEAGIERWRSAPLPWPEWAAQGGAPADSLAVQAGWLADRIVLRWRLQPLYRGGAAPGPSRTKSPAAHGCCLLDAASGALHGAPAGVDDFTVQAPPQEPCDDPCVMAQQVLGGVRYRLQQTPLPGVQPTEALHTTLTAHDPACGLDLWQCLLDDTPRKAPRALRS